MRCKRLIMTTFCINLPLTGHLIISDWLVGLDHRKSLPLLLTLLLRCKNRHDEYAQTSLITDRPSHGRHSYGRNEPEMRRGCFPVDGSTQQTRNLHGVNQQHSVALLILGIILCDPLSWSRTAVSLIDAYLNVSHGVSAARLACSFGNIQFKPPK